MSRWFNTGAFVRQPAFTFGDAGRNLVTAPRFRNLELALYNVFGIDEKRYFQLRGEFLGLINSAAAAGIVQIAAKFYF